jgi:hypothetical protein
VEFVEREFNFYSRAYLQILLASRELRPKLEPIFYNAQLGFTWQYQVLLATLHPDDSESVVEKKLRIVAMYLEMLLVRRIWNFRSITYSTMQYAMFSLTRDIRNKDVVDLAQVLRRRLDDDPETFGTNDRLYVHQQNRWQIHNIMARITDYVERRSDMPSRYLEYVTGTGQRRYEVEHIWANKPERHADEFTHPADFHEYRNRIGGLLLLPKSFNASYGDLPYEEKLAHYNHQNLVARSLHPDCYDHNPGFLRFVRESYLPFRPHVEFRKADLDERQVLYRRIAEQVWSPERLTREAAGAAT